MQSITEAGPLSRDKGARIKPQVDLWVCMVLLLLLNVPLFLAGDWSSHLIFIPGAVRDGEWWRMLTAPFVHNSGYHLLIDGLAFVLLYSGLHKTLPQRLVVLGASAFGGLLVPWWSVPQIQEIGLCGMSGVAHGLMAVCALELCRARNKRGRWAGYLSFAIVIAKCMAEAVSGILIFDLVHFGSVGVPIVACHGGGVIGALLAQIILNYLSPEQTSEGSR